MAIFLNSQRIHDKLIDLAANGVFQRVSYDKTTGFMTPMFEDDGITPKVSPAASKLANETSSSFEESRQRQTYKRDRSSWDWELHLKFEAEVNMEAFVDDLSDNPPRLPKTADYTFGVLLDLIDYRVSHPPKQSSTSGSRFVFSFRARSTRR